MVNPSSYFFLQVEKNDKNANFINKLEYYSNKNKKQIYIINKPLFDNKYSYDYEDAFVVLIPEYKILFCNFNIEKTNIFEDYVEDFIEDLASISDKFRYKEIIGRPRNWKEIIEKENISDSINDLNNFLNKIKISSPIEQRKCELLISLLTGSINDTEKVKLDIPDNLLDRVKQKILLFDGDQTRFIYNKLSKKKIIIQGLSGTGKTELLLHKLKDIYINNSDSKILFTCHNKILADNLRKRIPDFFNFMKVEEQIKWNQRLWCVNAWGLQKELNSGAYRYICYFYNIEFLSYSKFTDFDKACKIALQKISIIKETEEDFKYAFDFILIDESQDFPKSFFDLCELITKETVYIAGDIFQSIFDNLSKEVKPDFLLNNCYRTDPRTLMFGHTLGLGLFESPKLRWLTDKEWLACGYKYNKKDNFYYFKRNPIRRFEDTLKSHENSMEILEFNNNKEIISKIIEIILDLKDKNSTILPDDIAIIFIDNKTNTYNTIDLLEYEIQKTGTGYEINKAYESKEKIKGKIFVSNANNVKGLEFPFVICVTEKIISDYTYRNALYMIITRSFIKTFLLISSELNESEFINNLKDNLKIINNTNNLKILAPNEYEKKRLRETIINTTSESMISCIELIEICLEEEKVDNVNEKELLRNIVLSIVNSHVYNGNYNKETILKIIKQNKAIIN